MQGTKTKLIGKNTLAQVWDRVSPALHDEDPEVVMVADEYLADVLHDFQVRLQPREVLSLLAEFEATFEALQAEFDDLSAQLAEFEAEFERLQAQAMDDQAPEALDFVPGAMMPMDDPYWTLGDDMDPIDDMDDDS